jgi:hypothetical protein
MIQYIVGLVLVISALELTIALALASRGALPSPSSSFLLVYALVDIGLFAAGGYVVIRGLQALRGERATARTEATTPDQPPE